MIACCQQIYRDRSESDLQGFYTKNFRKHFYPFDEPYMYAVCLLLQGFLSSNVIHFSHGWTFRGKTMRRLNLQRSSCFDFCRQSVLLIILLIIGLQLAARNAKLTLDFATLNLRFCCRDFFVAVPQRPLWLLSRSRSCIHIKTRPKFIVTCVTRHGYHKRTK